MVSRWEVRVEGPAVDELLEDLAAGPIVDDHGTRLLTEQRVAEIDGLTIHIFADEHPPPHFCVKYCGESANFRISDGTKLNGRLDRFERNIRRWHKANRSLLIQQWNTLRPSDCPVGLYKD
jgi:hypothetical protein